MKKGNQDFFETVPGFLETLAYLTKNGYFTDTEFFMSASFVRIKIVSIVPNKGEKIPPNIGLIYDPNETVQKIRSLIESKKADVGSVHYTTETTDVIKWNKAETERIGTTGSKTELNLIFSLKFL